MATEPLINIDYVTKDYEGFFQLMKDNIPTLTPEWTDTSNSDNGIVILQLLSYGLHVLGYYQDKSVMENFIQTARTKKAVLLLSKFLGYTPKNQKAAQATLTFTKDASQTSTYLTIPKGTKISTSPTLGTPIIFETDETLVLDEGVTTGDVSATHGETVYLEIVGVGDGTASQKYVLEYADVIEDSMVIQTTENNNEYYWTRVDNLVDSKPTDRHYTTELLDDNRTVITFGDGVSGMKPLIASNIRGTYRYGGGVIGNLAANKLVYFYSGDVKGIVSVNNATDATGGEDYESLEHIRAYAPKAYRMGGKVVTAQDYQDYAELIDGVSKAVSREMFNATSDIEVYIAPTDYSVPTQALLDEVKAEIDKVRVVNSNLIVYSCLYKNFDLSLTVHVNDNFVANDVKQDVYDVLMDFLKADALDFGQTIYFSQIMQKCLSVTGVKNVVIDIPAADITSDFNELLILNTLTVNTSGGV